MGLSNGESNIIYLNIKKVNDVPKFQKYLGKNEQQESQYEYYPQFSGFFQGIEFSDKEITYQGKTSTKREVKLKFIDEGQEYVITSLMGGIMRSLLNMLNSAEQLETLTIKLYKNGAGYSSVYAENNGEKLEWALSWDDQKSMIKPIEANGDTINDYTELNEALESVSKNLKAIDIKKAQSDAVVQEMGLEDDVF